MTTAAHPDELTLAAWSEQRLLEFEREDVEAHLAECAACRALVATLDVAAPAAEPLGAPGAGAAPWLRRAPWLVVAATAAAALLLLVGPWFGRGRPAAPRLQLDVAGRLGDVFAETRSTPQATGELYVGVRLDEDAWVRLVAIDAAGAVHEVPLDPEGTTTEVLPGGADTFLGPFPAALAPDNAVTRVLALASREALAWSAVEPLVTDGADALRRELHASVTEVELAREP
ncbi:MAG: hypothetical protein H6828_05575 [Planctomycetes bacterium]|nr:hypothetical protein [Planctomycetota bacterium]